MSDGGNRSFNALLEAFQLIAQGDYSNDIIDMIRTAKEDTGLHELAALVETAVYRIKAREHGLKKKLDVLQAAERNWKENLLDTIVTLVNAIEARDPYTRGHSMRVAQYATALAKEMKLSASEQSLIRIAGLLHDIGKIGIPDKVLHKPSALNEVEYEIIKRHPGSGANIIRDLEYLQNVIPYVKCHHEKFDGSGYPDGLAGVDIPLGARIIGVVDAFDAMTSKRPYRDPMPLEKALEIISDNAGTQFDTDCVMVFIYNCRSNIRRISETGY